MKLAQEILEFIYYITAGPVFVFFAYKGLEHIKAAKENLKISKESIKTQSLRDSYRLAGEQCKYFAEDIVPLAKKFFKELEIQDCKFLEKFQSSIDKDKIKFSLLDGQTVTNQDLEILNNSEYLTDLINKLEGFSMYFCSGVANEKVGFITAGRGYCGLVKDLLPIVIPRIKEGYYKNISMLFINWQNKVKTENIKMEQKRLQKDLENTSSINIATIGQ